jgi:glucose/arabinose dehydrogenase
MKSRASKAFQFALLSLLECTGKILKNRWMQVSLFLLMVFQLAGSANADLQFQSVASDLPNPVGLTHAGDGSGRLFITLQDGRIFIFDGAGILPTPFLDIRSQVSCCGERGLLSVAFHPNYASNGFFFVNYTNRAGSTIVARYQVSEDPNVANPRSRRIILTVFQPFANHNGGQLQFGPDGFLYIGLGDGGSAGDPATVHRTRDLFSGKCSG